MARVREVSKSNTESSVKAKRLGRGVSARLKALDLGMIQTLYGFGLIDEQISAALGVPARTLTYWRKNEDFSAAVRAGKEIADSRVERSLYERAMGYSHLDTDIRVVRGEVVKTEFIKNYPPDTAACIFWLKNRRPDLWREKHELAVHGDNAQIMVVMDSRAIDAVVGILSNEQRPVEIGHDGSGVCIPDSGQCCVEAVDGESG